MGRKLMAAMCHEWIIVSAPTAALPCDKKMQLHCQLKNAHFRLMEADLHVCVHVIMLVFFFVLISQTFEIVNGFDH